VDRDIASKFVEDDERMTAIVIEFLTAIPSPPGRRLTAAGLPAMVALYLGRWD
jgi:hypothetical protein